MKKYLVFSLILMLALSACNTATKTAGTSASQGSGTGTPASAGGAQPPEDKGAETTPPKEEAKNDDALASVKSILSQKSVEYKVKYSYTATASGQASSGIQTMAFKGGKVRQDVEINGMKSSTFMLDGKIYSCSEFQSKISCLELPASQAQTPKGDSELRDNLQDYTLIPKGTRTIAGALATCFEYTVEKNGVSTTSDYCYSSDGAPLYIKSVSGTTSTEMTATEYSKTVADSEFTLPATPQQMPAIPGQ